LVALLMTERKHWVRCCFRYLWLLFVITVLNKNLLQKIASGKHT